MNCSMCGGDVGAEYKEIGKSKFCSNCTGHYPPNKIRDVVESEYTSKSNKDAVNPDHYKTGGLEVIDILKAKLSDEAFKGFLVGNVLKYVFRYDKKNGLEDLKKAEWYLDRLEKEVK